MKTFKIEIYIIPSCIPLMNYYTFLRGLLYSNYTIAPFLSNEMFNSQENKLVLSLIKTNRYVSTNISWYQGPNFQIIQSIISFRCSFKIWISNRKRSNEWGMSMNRWLRIWKWTSNSDKLSEFLFVSFYFLFLHSVSKKSSDGRYFI